MLFSVIIPVYNVEQYLSECINSVLSQSCGDYEIILVDDGSKDTSGAICDAYQKLYPEVVTVYHKKNEGLLLARRDGIEKAKGLYYVFMDSDDVLPPGTLDKYRNCIEMKHPDFILTDVYYWNSKNNTLKCEQKLSSLPHAPVSGALSTNLSILEHELLSFGYCCWSMWQKCVRNVSVQTDFNFRKLKGLQYGEDTLQTLFLFNNSKNFVYLDECCYKYRQGSGMMGRVPFKRIKDFYYVTEIMREECKFWDNEYTLYINRWLSIIVANYILDLYISCGSDKYILKTRFTEVLDYKKVKDYLNEVNNNESEQFCLGFVQRKIIHFLVTKKYDNLLRFLTVEKFYKKAKKLVKNIIKN